MCGCGKLERGGGNLHLMSTIRQFSNKHTINDVVTPRKPPREDTQFYARFAQEESGNARFSEEESYAKLKRPLSAPKGTRKARSFLLD